MRWAIVVGIDEYGDPGLRLSASVSDACDFRDWVVRPDGGGVPESNLRLLLSPTPEDTVRAEGVRPATKDNIVTAIDEVVSANADQQPERLYFYFAGHGITARVSNRDEAALVTPGFSKLHTDHSLAVRSIAEYFETTSFADQFLFIDACRNIPWADREFEVGLWPVPRRRDPGAPPTQQFILYATAPGHAADEVGWPGEATGAFTSALLEGLEGIENAKAWSWERNCYEVRWERLASFINTRMTARLPAGVPETAWQVQVPQDTGTRGVANRDRDVSVVSFPSGSFTPVELTVELAVEAKIEDAEVSVLDALGEPVASALGVTGESQRFQLAPKTYAVRVTTTAPKELFGSLKAPIELYGNRTEKIALRPRETQPTAGQSATEQIEPEEMGAGRPQETDGSIAIESGDVLTVAEIVDETGRVVAVTPAGEAARIKPGFYHIRQIGPEATTDAKFVVLKAGETEPVVLRPERTDPAVIALATAMGGRIQGRYVNMGEELIAWPLASTIVAAGVATALTGATPPALGLADLRESLGDGSGIAVVVVGGGNGGRADDQVVRQLRVAIWPAGEPVEGPGGELDPSGAGVAGLVHPVGPQDPSLYWVSFTAPGADPMVISVPVLPRRLATLVAQIDSDRIRLHQYHPSIDPDASSTVGRLRRVEYLQRMLVAGRVDIVERLARQLAEMATDDPFAGIVAGYVLLRLGLHEELGELASAVVTAAPTLSDAYILRGEYEAHFERPEVAEQAFLNAVNCGIPAFGEGLTRLLEGLRSSRVIHPRAAVVRHIFQRHARGSMWAAFNPRRGLEPGRAVISAADLGLEA
jgi:caspase domain-containing protein